MIRIKRIYEEACPEDGFRVLVDRLWPRGISRENSKLDLWMKEISPSHALRKWYQHDAARWAEFCDRYRQELQSATMYLQRLKALEEEHGTLTLRYGAKTQTYNHALVLRELLFAHAIH